MIKVEVTDVFDKWLKGLRDLRGKEPIFERIRRLSQGHFGDVKSVGDGVSEARINYGPGYRLYYVRRGEGSSFCFVAAISHHRKEISQRQSQWQSRDRNDVENEKV